MVAIATGLWWDYSRPAVQAATLTLPSDLGNVLLSGLTVLVTVAGVSFWNIAAFVLHSLRVLPGSGPVSVLSLQHRVILRNSPGAIGTAWEAVKIYLAWYSTRPPRLFMRTIAIVVPALIISAGFAIAAVFVSHVASRANGFVIARAQPENCGFWWFDRNNIDGVTAGRIKQANDTLLARTYVANFYANTTTSSTARSIFVQPALPYTTNPSAPCPIPASERCILGPNAAFGMKTAILDSQESLGINARAEDRVGVEISVTCSQVSTRGLRWNNDTHFAFTFGGYFAEDAADNVTYLYYLGTELSKVARSMPLIRKTFSPRAAFVRDSRAWVPIPEFNRTDADVSVFFLSQNDISYLSPVQDRFFLANGTVKYTDQGGRTFFRANSYVNTMVCAEQYAVCNPSTSSCTAPGGWQHLYDAILTENPLGFNTGQIGTAGRVLLALVDANMYSSVAALGAGALWANNLASGNISPGLPDNQWQTEVLGWFQTSLAKLQAYMVEYASSTAGLGPFGATEESPYGYRSRVNATTKELWDQCENQLIRTAGDVQNFNFAGVVIIACVSVSLMLLDCALGTILNLAVRYLGFGPAAEMARQWDANLNLLRMALESPGADDGVSGWKPGRWGIPVLDRS
ncbi:hypothetical protein N657DRAFT_664830 [Parathielavia appendiculata]|uniref:Uncharacterized protein n=1 Tax=Parathielavia appendiculata TaxID=2587402 RepID=A0AAN6Z315_9PEZI|nr:hypothetical protein N657DRAFT_664830 [Parathielavia appendiculata]